MLLAQAWVRALEIEASIASQLYSFELGLLDQLINARELFDIAKFQSKFRQLIGKELYKPLILLRL